MSTSKKEMIEFPEGAQVYAYGKWYRIMRTIPRPPYGPRYEVFKDGCWRAAHQEIKNLLDLDFEKIASDPEWYELQKKIRNEIDTQLRERLTVGGTLKPGEEQRLRKRWLGGSWQS